jgi:hypothetical protein
VTARTSAVMACLGLQGWVVTRLLMGVHKETILANYATWVAWYCSCCLLMQLLRRYGGWLNR